MDGIKINAVCEDCGKKFAVASENLKSVETQKDGRSITILYYDCQSCGRSHFVQADDDITRYKLEQCTKMMCRLSVKRKNGTVSKKDAKQFAAQRKELNDLRHKIMGELTGHKINVNGREIDLRFSI